MSRERNEHIHPLFKALFDDMALIYPVRPELPDYMRTAESPNSDEVAALGECGFAVNQNTGD